MAKQNSKPQLPVLDKRNPISRGLVVDYPFFEKGGTLLHDTSGRANNCTLSNVTTSSFWGKTGYGNTGTFDGTNDFGTINYRAELDSQNALSVEAIFSTTTLATFQYIIDRWTYTPGNFRLWSLAVWNPDRIWFRASNNGLDAGVTGVSVTVTGRTNEMLHVVGTYNALAPLISIYLDGKLRSTAAGPSVIASSTQPIYVGAGNQGADNPFSGKISLLRVWRRCLTASEVLRLYKDPYGIYRKDTTPISEDNFL